MANQQFERTDRIASEIMRETEKIIREDVSDPRTDCMFSITHVDVTRDLRYAKVYVSIYEEEKRAPMMKALKTAAGLSATTLGGACSFAIRRSWFLNWTRRLNTVCISQASSIR